MRRHTRCRCSRRRFLGASVAPVAVAVAGPRRHGPWQAHARQTPPAFEVLGAPGGYSSQPAHWYLADLQQWRGRIYAAHGDWNANTGPVRVVYVDPASGALVQDNGFQFDDEAIESFVVLNDVIWAIGTDARESWEFGNVYRAPLEGDWEKLRTVPGAVHLFGLGQLNEVLVASGGNEVAEGIIWQSHDGGRTWEIATIIENPSLGTKYPIHVYSHVFTLGGRLFVTTPASGCFAFDGVGWTPAECVPTTAFGVTKSVPFGGAVAMVPYSPWRVPLDEPLGPGLMVFDGQEYWSIDVGTTVRDVVADTDALYVLTEDTLQMGVILRATDLSRRCATAFTEAVMLGPEFPAPRSLERVDGRFYVGLADGRLIRSRSA